MQIELETWSKLNSIEVYRGNNCRCKYWSKLKQIDPMHFLWGNNCRFKQNMTSDLNYRPKCRSKGGNRFQFQARSKCIFRGQFQCRSKCIFECRFKWRFRGSFRWWLLYRTKCIFEVDLNLDLSGDKKQIIKQIQKGILEEFRR